MNAQKRIVSIVLVLCVVLIFFMTACGGSEINENDTLSSSRMDDKISETENENDTAAFSQEETQETEIENDTAAYSQSETRNTPTKEQQNATPKKCTDCGGSGEISCTSCDGLGYTTFAIGSGYQKMTCFGCEGDGKSECYACDGKGTITENPGQDEYDGGGSYIPNNPIGGGSGNDREPERELCHSCGGRGFCATCNGLGYISNPYGGYSDRIECGGCYGKKTCQRCLGSRYE